MAKIVDASATEEQPALEPAMVALTLPAPQQLKFRDRVYTSRLLFVPGTDLSYPVDKAVVLVPASDIEAVKFLKANEEFELLRE